jgi:dUTP pyrophosphatase
MYIGIIKMNPDLPTPHYKTEGSSGMDLYSAEDFPLQPNRTKLIKTGIKVCIPENFEGQIRPRSGLALKHGITMVNSPGTIDSDYRGEIGIILHNLGTETFKVVKGDRIAQLIISPVAHVGISVVDKLSETDRGEGGFGHTGKD